MVWLKPYEIECFQIPGDDFEAKSKHWSHNGWYKWMQRTDKWLCKTFGYPHWWQIAISEAYFCYLLKSIAANKRYEQGIKISQ